MIKYEYKLYKVPSLDGNILFGEAERGGKTMVEFLNEFGKEGWQLCVVYPYNKNNTCYIFKRKLNEFE